MNPENYSPELRELIAKDILLSLGGNAYPRQKYGELTFPVVDESGHREEKPVSSIHFTPGWSHGGYYLFFADGFAPLAEEEHRQKAWDYIIRNYPFPDKDILINKETLDERIALRERNIAFICRHGDMDADDFMMVKAYRRVLTRTRDAVKETPVPLPGDIVEGAYYGGKHPFTNGLVDRLFDSDTHPVSVCAKPHIPFIGTTRGTPYGYHLSVSGGPFFGFKVEDLEYVEPDRRFFCDFGHNGACAGGSIEFEATVNRWRIKEGVDY